MSNAAVHVASIGTCDGRPLHVQLLGGHITITDLSNTGTLLNSEQAAKLAGALTVAAEHANKPSTTVQAALNEADLPAPTDDDDQDDDDE